MRIFLIGFMGAGKSFLGKKLAEAVAFDFLDLDDFIVSTEQKQISHIFREQGEAYFRFLEKKYLHKTLSQSNAVIATGGGTPCFYNNMDWMLQHGWVIYLDASPELLFQRLHQAPQEQRPLLEKRRYNRLLQYIEHKLAYRQSFYKKAHLILHQESSQQTTTDILIQYIKQYL